MVTWRPRAPAAAGRYGPGVRWVCNSPTISGYHSGHVEGQAQCAVGPEGRSTRTTASVGAPVCRTCTSLLRPRAPPRAGRNELPCVSGGLGSELFVPLDVVLRLTRRAVAYCSGC